MNSIQKRYSIAKVNYEKAYARYADLMKPYDYLLESETGIDEHVDHEMRIEKEVGLDVARNEEREAEKALLAWAKGVVTGLPEARKSLGDLDKVFNCRLSTVREKVIELSLDLNA